MSPLTKKKKKKKRKKKKERKKENKRKKRTKKKKKIKIGNFLQLFTEDTMNGTVDVDVETLEASTKYPERQQGCKNHAHDMIDRFGDMCCNQSISFYLGWVITNSNISLLFKLNLNITSSDTDLMADYNNSDS